MHLRQSRLRPRRRYPASGRHGPGVGVLVVVPVDEQLDDGLGALADELLLLARAGDERNPTDGVHVAVRQLLQGAVARLAWTGGSTGQRRRGRSAETARGGRGGLRDAGYGLRGKPGSSLIKYRTRVFIA